MKTSLRTTVVLVSALLALAGCGGGNGAGAGGAATVQATSAQDGDFQATATVDSPSVAASATVDASVTAITKVSERRIDRTVFEYTYGITVRNGSAPQVGLHAALISGGPGTTVVSGDVNVGDVAAGATVTPSGTVVIRQDRQLPLVVSQLVWQFSAQGATSGLASVRLDASQTVIGSGDSFTATATALDADGQMLVRQPAFSYRIIVPGEGPRGTPPTVFGNEVRSSASTVGGYVLEATAAGGSGPSATARLAFAVIVPASTSANSGVYVSLSAAQGQLSRGLVALKEAVDRADTAGITAARTAVASAAQAVDLFDLSISTIFAPPVGFIPGTEDLTARGIAPNAADGVYQDRTNQARARLRLMMDLLNKPGRLQEADLAALIQYTSELEAIETDLAADSAAPSIFGVVQTSSQAHALLALDMPKLLKAMANRLELELSAQTSVSPSSSQQRAQAVRLGFGLNDVIKWFGGPAGKVVTKMYGTYISGIENQVALMEARDLLKRFLPTNLVINGIKTGPSVSFQAYNVPGSYIDIAGVSLEDAKNADVYLVGNAVIQAMRSLSIPTRPPKEAPSTKEVYEYFKGVRELAKGVQEVGEQVERMVQFPSSATINNFIEDGGCFPSYGLGLDSCIQLNYLNGFLNVSGNNPTAFVVLMFVRTGGPVPQYDSFLANFAPGT